MGTDPDKLPELKILDANENKILTARMLSETWQEFIPLIAFKTWAFHPVPDTETIYLSDNPVVMHNELDFGPRGNLGVDVKGVELYLPLSSNAVLGMYCPQMTAALQRRYREMVSDHAFMEWTMTPDTRETIETLFTGSALARQYRLTRRMSTLLTRFRWAEPSDMSMPQAMILN